MKPETINVAAFIVTDGTNAATTESRVAELISGVNQIYTQVGMTFQGHSGHCCPK